MKALTLTQPWATLVAIGAKTIETRSWLTTYRGRIAIHAAKGIAGLGGKAGFQALCAQEPFNSCLTAHANYEIERGITPLQAANLIPFGAIIATCTLVNCMAITESFARHEITAQERAFGDYMPGRYAWFLHDVEKLETPIPCPGALGLWNWDEKGYRS